MFSNIFRRPRTLPHPLIAANHHYFKKFDKTSPLQDCELVVFDTELTGLSLRQDEIIAIGAVRIRNMRIIAGETFYALVKPEGNQHTQSTLLHRITPQELTTAKPLSIVLPEFLQFCGNAFVVGHFVRLDLDFVNRATGKMLGGSLRTPYLDTMRLAMVFNEYKHGHYYDHYNLQSAYNLAALAKEFELPKFAEHNALQDSLQTAYLFLFLVKKMRKYGLRTIGDFLKAGRKWKILP